MRGQHLFTREISSMMNAFGDVEDPLPASIAMLEEIFVDYLINMCQVAAQCSGNRNKVRVDDIMFCLRHDARKLGRTQELLRLQKEISDARRQYRFDDD